jgi:hypothetical protein
VSERTYRAVVAAAETADATDSKSSWGLADAVLTHIPDNGHGGDRRSSTPRGVLEQLGELAQRMADDGVTTPQGKPYTSKALSKLRLAAMAWPMDERHENVAFRTHQEAQSERARPVLASLVEVATTRRRVEAPATISEDAWQRAVGRVRGGGPARGGYLVNANDVREALQRRRNVPERHPRGAATPAPSPTPTGGTAAERRDAAEQHDHNATTAVLGDDTAVSMAVVHARGELAKANEAVMAASRHLARATLSDERRMELRADVIRLQEQVNMLAAQIAGAPADASDVLS